MDAEERRTEEQNSQLFIITGLSGAGKSTVLRVFEDLRYFAVDGLPPAVAPDVARIMSRSPVRDMPGMALSMDMRQKNSVQEFRQTIKKLLGLNLRVRLIFLEADDEAVMRRYAATRRPHPLENGGGLESAIAEEKELLAPIRDMADLVINTTDFSIHDLRRNIQRLFTGDIHAARLLRINVISFGFKYGIPSDSDFMFDLRFLDNPYFVEKLKPLSGKDKAVSDYIFNNPEAQEFKRKLLDFMAFCLKLMEKEGRYRVTIAFGCTGGRHRSVAMAEEIAQALRQAGYVVSVGHRHLNRDAMQK